MARIGIGYLIQETNSFSPIKTRFEDFHLSLGDKLVDCWKGTKTEIGGFLDFFSDRDEQVVPLFASYAMTAGPIERAEFERLISAVMEQIHGAGQLDGLLLALMAAKCAEGTDDCDGVMLEAIRGALGPSLPIAITLDLHANVTGRVAALADIIVGYQTYPHVDIYETGLAAAGLLLDTLQGRLRPVTAVEKIPMIVPAENMQTTHGPMAEVFRTGYAYRAMHPEIRSVSAFGAQPWLDIEEIGCTTVVVADGNRSLAADGAAEMARKFWELRKDFEVELLEPGRAVREALATEGQPVVLSESSDSPTAGSPGDSADMLRALLEQAPGVPAALWVRDPTAVQQAWNLGPRATLRAALGGAFDKVYRRPVPFEGRIRSLSDGRFTNKGRFNTGMPLDMGRTAVVEAGPISVVISEGPTEMIDPELYRSQGIEPRDKKIVVVKSANGFRDEYGQFAARIIMVDTPGICSANLRSLPYRRIPRPIYPFDAIEFSLREVGR